MSRDIDDDFPVRDESPRAPIVMEQAPQPEPDNGVISLDVMRSAMIAKVNYEPEDLDVPAFLRKRNEAM